MDCWEHETAGQGSVPAVAFCRHCGAALCREHATVCTDERVRQNGMGSPTRLLPDGRKICCSTCRDAFVESIPVHRAEQRRRELAATGPESAAASC